jgi:hypothetical protein
MTYIPWALFVKMPDQGRSYGGRHRYSTVENLRMDKTFFIILFKFIVNEFDS